MNAKDAANLRAAPRVAPTLSRTPAGRRQFVLRLVRDRAARAAAAEPADTTTQKAS
jgi:hypothetical protein